MNYFRKYTLVMTTRKCDVPCDQQDERDKNHTLSDSEKKVLKFRFDFPVKTLCPEHYKDQFVKYEHWHKKYSDPCMRHHKPVKVRLHEISLDLALEVDSNTEHKIIPGQKLCRPCLYHLRELIITNTELVSGDVPIQEDVEDVEDDREDEELENIMFDSPKSASPM